MIKTVDNKQVFYKSDAAHTPNYGSKVYSNTNNEHVKRTIFYAKESDKSTSSYDKEFVLFKDLKFTEPVSNNELVEAMLSGLIVVNGLEIISPSSLLLNLTSKYSYVRFFQNLSIDFEKKESIPCFDIYYSKEWLDIE